MMVRFRCREFFYTISRSAFLWQLLCLMFITGKQILDMPGTNRMKQTTFSLLYTLVWHVCREKILTHKTMQKSDSSNTTQEEVFRKYAPLKFAFSLSYKKRFWTRYDIRIVGPSEYAGGQLSLEALNDILPFVKTIAQLRFHEEEVYLLFFFCSLHLQELKQLEGI